MMLESELEALVLLRQIDRNIKRIADSLSPPMRHHDKGLSGAFEEMMDKAGDERPKKHDR